MITRCAVSLVALVLMVPSPCLLAQDTTGLRRSEVHGVTLMPGGMMTPDEAKALGRRFVGLKAIPDSVSIGVGDTLSFGSIRFMAVDSLGRSLGRLLMVDPQLPDGAATLLLFQAARGVRPGVSILTVTVPRPYWFRADEARPATQVRIKVHQ